ncbi:alpha/beta hydrolase [Thiomicrorhabdus xiamenensis]|uniref:Alpha/beta hydrolase n=1 Tax=Thiomicrorhabdus xiamenensis TaxID=2739063 RepID=A0A7D4NNB2_9GAMM|nr:alpha/beta fold hydrolase [Thiomicrorhabdus xiamenensis]QKI88593.1 alpha/beta hydrolase [Thiomicrorhabdus xiamenensis]
MKSNHKGLLIPGAVGEIEAEFVLQDENLVIISHPHPLYGGTMHNKVVTTLWKAYQEMGFSTLRYNFRGVGMSEGEHDYAQGEVEDLKAVLRWARTQGDFSRVHLAGFSFGSYISIKAASELKPASLCTVAPPVGLYSFESQDIGRLDSATQWLLIQGGQDEVVAADGVLQWVETLSHKPDICWREQASHFFHGELLWLRKAVALIQS